MPDVLLYGSIDAYSSSELINEIIEANTEDVTIRVNCSGGEVQYGMGIIAKFSELKGKKLLKNDGKAYSMAAFLFCYADDSEAIDTADFIFHRAAYASWIESNPEYFDDASKLFLDKTNKKLRTALEAKVDVPLLEKISGITMDELFSMDGRAEILLSAKDAKKIGLINRVATITPKKKSEIEAKILSIAAHYAGVEKEKPKENNFKKPNMNIDEIKATYPLVAAALINEGVAQERDRVEACLVFLDADPKGVMAAIEAGKPLSSKQMAEFNLAATNKAVLAKIETEAPANVTTTEAAAVDKKTTAETEKATALAAFESAVDKNLNLKK